MDKRWQLSNLMTPHIPAGVWNAIDYERLAPQHMDAGRLAYVAGGCGWDRTVAANCAAFAAWAIVPRLLRDVRGGHTRLTLGGLDLPHPLLLAPVAHQRLAHSEAEVATARAARTGRGRQPRSEEHTSELQSH